jgi:trehalose synthase
MSPLSTPSLIDVSVLPVDPGRFEQFVDGSGARDALTSANERGRELFEGHALWSVSSRSRSGGLSELLASQTAYARGAGIDARWEVIGASDDFFRLTKRVHNNLHGEGDDGDGYGAAERVLYEDTLRVHGSELSERLSPRDVVVLHDPQTVGMIDAVKDAGAFAIWRCHIGADMPNETARRAWRFLDRYAQRADGYVFSRLQFVWESLDHAKAFVILPSLNPLSPKNQDFSPETVSEILAAAGIQPGASQGGTTFVRLDGSPGRVDRGAELVESAPLEPGTDVILQVSHWNRLKDPLGVLEWFATLVAPRCDAHLVLVGPEVGAVADEPESRHVFRKTLTRWRELEAGVRARVHLVSIQADDPEESAAVINALQRRATVVVQKSRGEGFGMTVLEAMWKRRPVVCTRVGGLQEQVVDGVTGFLRDLGDPEGAAAAALDLLADLGLRERLGSAGHERVRRHFLLPREVVDWSGVFERVVAGR